MRKLIEIAKNFCAEIESFRIEALACIC